MKGRDERKEQRFEERGGPKFGQGSLFFSGHTDLAIVQPGMRFPGTTFPQKAFSRAVLTRKIREILDS